MKFNVICCDPPWLFGDKLDKMKATRKRGAAAHYSGMTTKEIADIDVLSIVEDDALLALWVPGTHLFEAQEIMFAWGFTYKQNAVWAKVLSDAEQRLRDHKEKTLRDTLKMGMGRLFRQCHETVLLATRGNVYPKLMDKGQRSVMFAENKGHSSKPEDLQDSLEKMFPEAKKLEMFARRKREGWTCVGNEIDGLDVNDSINILSRIGDFGEDVTDTIGIIATAEGVRRLTPKGATVAVRVISDPSSYYAAQKVLRAPREDGIILL